MTIISLAAAVVAVIMVLLAVVLIPTIVEVRKTVAATRDFITRTDAELQPILKELYETLTDLKALTGGMAEHADEIKGFMGVVGETGRGLRTISSLVGAVAGAIGSSSLWLTGVKVGGKFLLDKIAKKGR